MEISSACPVGLSSRILRTRENGHTDGSHRNDPDAHAFCSCSRGAMRRNCGPDENSIMIADSRVNNFLFFLAYSLEKYWASHIMIAVSSWPRFEKSLKPPG